MHVKQLGMQSWSSSMQSADASFRSAGELQPFCCRDVHATGGVKVQLVYPSATASHHDCI